MYKLVKVNTKQCNQKMSIINTAEYSKKYFDPLCVKEWYSEITELNIGPNMGTTRGTSAIKPPPLSTDNGEIKSADILA